jgi:hypothetical protein
VVFSVNCELCASVCFFVRVQLPIGHESWSRHIVIRHENITTKCNGMKFFVCLFVFPASSWLGVFYFSSRFCVINGIFNMTVRNKMVVGIIFK